MRAGSGGRAAGAEGRPSATFRTRWLGLGALVAVAVLLVGWWFSPPPAAPDAPASSRGTAEVLSLPAGGPRPSTAEVPEALQLCGQVRDAQTGAPVAGAQVSVAPAPAEATRRSVEVTTDAGGVWKVDGAPPAGHYALAIHALGYRPSMRIEAARPCRVGAWSEALQPGGVRIRGSVKDVTGGEIAGASVAFRRGPVAASWETTSRDDGTFELTLDPGAYLVRIHFEGYAERQELLEVPPSSASFEFELLPGARLEGVAREADSGRPVAGARILLVAGEQPVVFTEQPTTVADQAGRFSIEGISPGELTLHAWADGRRSARPWFGEVEPGGHHEGIELRLDATPSVSGVVVLAPEGAEAVAGARVIAHQGERSWISPPTADDGRFVFDAVDPGPLQLFVQSDTHANQVATTDVQVGEANLEDVRLMIFPGVVVRGLVRGGGPQTVVRVIVDTGALAGAQAPTTMANALLSTTCDASGEFALHGVAPGPITIVAEDPSGSGQVEVRVGETDPEPVELALAVHAGIRGVVIAETLESVAGIDVAWERIDPPSAVLSIPSNLAPVTRTDAEGRFEYAGLAPGRYRLRAMSLGRDVTRPEDPPIVDLENGSWATVTLEIIRETTPLVGSVKTGDGLPLVDAIVRVSAAHQPVTTAITDADGAFRVGPFGPGQALSVHVTDPSPGGTTTQREAIAGVPLEVTMPPGRSLSVNVSGIGRGQLELQGPRSVTQGLREDGPVQLERLPPGTYRILAEGDRGTASAEIDLEIEDGSVALKGRPWARVRGRLLGETGPLPGWTVVARSAERGVTLQTWQNVAFDRQPGTADDGTFALSGIRPGLHEFLFLPPRIAADRTFLALAEPIVVEAGSNRDLGDLDVREFSRKPIGTPKEQHHGTIHPTPHP